MPLPALAITMGDPAGVGPETVVSAWQDSAVHRACRSLVIGHPDVLQRAAKLQGYPLEITPLTRWSDDWTSNRRQMPCYWPSLGNLDDRAAEVAPAKISAAGGKSAYDAVVVAARLALERRIDVMTTGPLHKAALHAAGYSYPGHTELLAELCGIDDFAMMLHLPPAPSTTGPVGLNVIHATLHQSLQSAIEQLSQQRIVQTIQLAHEAVTSLAQVYESTDSTQIGVCALNPHAGEEGLFGREEIEIIAPAVEEMRRRGLKVTGPWPADTLMGRARQGEFDAVVAIYHDQGHIAVKLLDMHRAVNVTLGLPIIRTSVAHGTAFDLAWQGKAESEGMVQAIRTGAALASSKKRQSRRLAPRQ